MEGEGVRKVLAKEVWIGHKYGDIDTVDVLPVATTVARHRSGIATSRRQVLATELRKLPRLAITTDMWTHVGSNRPCITVSVHLIDRKWELRAEV